MVFQTRIVVTGIGAVTPFGVGVKRFWNELLAGKSAIRQMSDPVLRQWSPVAAEVLNLNVSDYLPRKLVMDTDRATQLGLIAAMEAIEHAGFIGQYPFQTTSRMQEIDPDRIGVAMGSAFGGIQSLEIGAGKLAIDSTTRMSPRLVSKSIPNAAAAAIAMQYGIRGPVMNYTTACASAANAIGEASYWLRSGEVDMVIAGGAECLFSPVILAGLKAAGALAVTGSADYSQWSRPFDKNRQGMVMGEGAAVIVLETLDHAVARGAQIYAELRGYGTSNDAYHETAPHPDGAGAILAMQRALHSGGLEPDDIDYINAHATSTPAGDRAEGTALKALFKHHLDKIPVSSIKGAIGHLLGAAGAISSIASILSIRTGWLPPTLHCDTPDPLAPPDIVPRSRNQKVKCVLSNSFGFGGQNGVLVWEAFESEQDIH